MTRALSAVLLTIIVLPMCASAGAQNAGTYPIIDTGQKKTYDDTKEIAFPSAGVAYYGQDAQYVGEQPAYRDNSDGTITDLNTGLTWQKSPDFKTLRTWDQATSYAAALNLAGKGDWRVPTLKELYSLIDFRGESRAVPKVPYIDTRFFDFQYPAPSSGLRDIDVQFWSSTLYVGTTMLGNATAFGVNFADGRIKGYPRNTTFARFVRCVRGGGSYGVNRFVDNKDGTITDQSTGLTWMQNDSGKALSWRDALAYAEGLIFAGEGDWRVPSAKELQSIVDYTRAPDATVAARRGPAIDPIFNVTDTESWCWASTTHLESAPNESAGVYVCFGQATGWMQVPPQSGSYRLLNVHGAGSQRSDPKSGDPKNFPYGRGPQGDVVRIYNYVRAVRGGVRASLRGSAYSIPASTGSKIDLSLDAGIANGKKNYLTVMSISGTKPGIPLPAGGGVLPLVWDPFSDAVLTLVNTTRFAGFRGVLDTAGKASARFDTLGTVPSNAVGTTIYCAYVVYHPIAYASNAVAIDIDS